jgi:WD40 repeat protein
MALKRRHRAALGLLGGSLVAVASLIIGSIFNVVDVHRYLWILVVAAALCGVPGVILFWWSELTGGPDHDHPHPHPQQPPHEQPLPLPQPPAAPVPETRRRINMAPSFDGVVVERLDLVRRTAAALLDDHESMDLTVLFGPGGFGKTTVAQLVCQDERVKDHFAGGVLWVVLGPEAQGAQLTALIAGLCRRLSGDIESFPDSAQAGYRLGELLEQRRDAGCPTLLVIDSVFQASQVTPFLYGRDLPRLVTTRIANLLPDKAVLIEVSELEAGQARELLTNGLPSIDPGLIDQLLDLTGGWVLPTAMINGYLRRQVKLSGPSVDAVATELIDRMRRDGPAVVDIRSPAGRFTTIRRTIRSSLAALPEPDQARYGELAVFPEATDIPLEVVRLLWAGTAGLSDAAADALCWEFAHLSLFTSFEAGRSLRLHAVIREFLRHEEGARVTRHNAALLDACATRMLPAVPAGSRRPWWRLPPGHDYLWRQVGSHLKGAGLLDELTQLVLDLRWAVAKSAQVGAAEVERDLGLTDDPTAEILRRTWVHQSHVLRPIQPAHSHADVVISRLGVVPELHEVVAAYRATLPDGMVRVRNHWPLPDTSQDTRRILAGSGGEVIACAYSPDGAWLVAGYNDGTARIWDLATASVRQVLAGHAAGVCAVAVSPDGSWLTTASHDGTAWIWDVSPDAAVRRCVLRGHDPDTWVTGVAIAPDGTWLATSGLDDTVRVWDPQTAAMGLTLPGDSDGLNCVAISPDGQWLATGGNDGTVRRWDPGSGALRATLTGHTSAVRSVAISPDGTWIASAGGDDTVRTWDIRTGVGQYVLTDHTDWVRAVAISADGSWLASGADDLTVRIFESTSGICLRTLSADEHGVQAIAISPDGTGVASAGDDGTVRIWEVTDTRMSGGRSQPMASMCGVAVAPDGTWLATSSYDSTVQIWDVHAAEVRTALRGHGGWVTGVAIAASGTWLATSSHDATARVWDLASGEPLLTLAGHHGSVRDVDIAPDDGWLATVGQDGTVRTWDRASGDPRWTGIAAGVLTSLAIARSGDWLATGGQDGTVRIWDAATGAQRNSFNTRTGWVTGVAISPDGAWLAASGEDRTVRIIDLRAGSVREILRGHTETVTGVTVSADGSRIATTALDNTLRIYNANGNEAVAAMRVDGPLLAGCWSADATVLFVVGARGVYAFAVDR